MRPNLLLLSFIFYGVTGASPYYPSLNTRSGAPSVKLDSATVTGVAVSSGAIEQFLGIPFALPPTGDRRFRLPVPVPAYNKSFAATNYGPYCPQIPEIVPGEPTSNVTKPQSEDCLTINVIRPTGYGHVKLPVVAWIFGGGFDAGGAADYDGSIIVQKSIDIGSPVVFVNFNHRVNGFGFMASQEITDAGVANLGLQDQREAYRWIQKYIGAFGGDHSKVTIFGQSSGAISVALQMLLNNGNTEGLFRAAWMDSGAPISIGSYTHGQKWYDAAVQYTGCAGANDTLTCLRTVPYDTLQAYFLTTPSKFSYLGLISAWSPRVDGKFLKDDPQKLVLEGSVPDIPFVTGNCDDEGTLFSLYSLNITTDDEFKGYINSVYFPNATASELTLVETLYPSDPSQGSPFNTGLNDTLSPQYKRISAFQGDAVFQGPRRFFLKHRSFLQNTWAFLDKRNKLATPLGSLHGTDMLSLYGTGNGTELQDYLINFAYHLDPNGPTHRAWPKYQVYAPKLLTLLDGPTPVTITEDNYRIAAMEGLTALGLKYPI